MSRIASGRRPSNYVKQPIITDPPDIDTIVRKYNIGRHELILLARHLARDRKLSSPEALRIIGTGKITLEDLKESLIKSLQTSVPEDDSIQSENDSPTQSK
jgi:hypothetical protein